MDPRDALNPVERRMIDEGRTIEAVRNLRIRLCLDLIEAKKIVDAYRNRCGGCDAPATMRLTLSDIQTSEVLDSVMLCKECFHTSTTLGGWLDAGK